ncbi:MAG: protein translocase subunit SecDF [Bacteroidales bacterium]|nr:protein translocase subunit SecDF [Bacteroidales bacterium]
MRLKGTIIFFTVLFILVSLFSLSFTWCTRKVEKAAFRYAHSEETKRQAEELSKNDPIKFQLIYDSLALAKESKYLDSMSSEVIYNLLVRKFTYRECKEREISLGLDLKGGMNVVLEVSEIDILKALSGHNKDPKFNQALEKTQRDKINSSESFVDIFVRNIKELEPQKPLAVYFATIENSSKIKPTSTDEEVITFLKDEVASAIDRTYIVLRKRIDKFGVAQPNIQKLSAQNRILIELPGVKDPTRVRKILQGTAKLEFWETWEFGADKIYDKFVEADKEIKAILKKQLNIQDTTPQTDTTQVSKEPTTLEEALTPVQTPKTDTSLKSTISENPLLSLFKGGLNIITDEKGQYYPGKGPLVGYVEGKDTSQVIRYLKMVSHIFPNTRFLWEAKPLTTKENKEFYGLIAIKITTPDGRPKLEGDKVVDAWQDYDQTGKVEVSMLMNSEGARIWKDMTGKNIGKSIAIVLDNIVYSYPVVQTEIAGGRSQITGNFTVAEAQDLANVLKSGKLPAPARIIQESIVGPSLGAESIHSSIISFIIAFIVVLIYMIFFYNKAGVAANIALFFNVFLIFGVLTSLGATLTLPGIAGIILTLGMAVDANVIIYERIKEELRIGKGIRLAIEDGYKNAYSAIIDGNVTTLITGIILAYFGTGPIQGFAVTLIIGILTSLFTSIFISRLFFEYLLDYNKKISFGFPFTLNILTNTKIDFIKLRKFGYVFSAGLITLSLISLFTKGLETGVDFAGGRSYVVRFDQPVKVNEIRQSLLKVIKEGVEVKSFGSTNQVRITTKYLINDNSTKADSLVEKVLYEGLKGFYKTPIKFEDFVSDNPDKVIGRLSSEKVGPTIAADIKRAGIYALILALIGIFIYIAIRFKRWTFGLGGVIALAHDSLITAGMYSLFSGILPFTLEVDQSFIAAILTIIGYSINDTVIIFDRIREFLKLFPKRNMTENINGAINSTLMRTLNTAGSTIVVLLALLIFGGDSIRGFTFALLIGVLIGTYSSIFVATPLAYDISKRKKQQ